MPVARTTERRQTEVLGVIRPGELLSTAAVMRHARIGENALHELRASGQLKPHNFNGVNWYESDDVIRIIRER